MSEFFTSLREAISGSVFSSISIIDILDVVLMAVIIYQLLKFFKHTKAMHVLKGVALLIIALAVAAWIGLPTVTWILSSVFTSGILVIVVIFQPELRRAFENLGRGHFNETEEKVNTDDIISEIVTVSDHLSRRRVGALMVFEQKSDLKDIIATGTVLDAKISAGLIENVFEPNTPLHDGAMILKGNKIVAAGCFLPLSENNSIEKTLGTRHRAALGMSERSDAVVIVVSEETGVISAARNGTLRRYLDLEALRDLLEEVYADENQPQKFSLNKVIAKFFGKEQTDEKK